MDIFNSKLLVYQRISSYFITMSIAGLLPRPCLVSELTRFYPGVLNLPHFSMWFVESYVDGKKNTIVACHPHGCFTYWSPNMIKYVHVITCICIIADIHVYIHIHIHILGETQLFRTTTNHCFCSKRTTKHMTEAALVGILPCSRRPNRRMVVPSPKNTTGESKSGNRWSLF